MDSFVSSGDIVDTLDGLSCKSKCTFLKNQSPASQIQHHIEKEDEMAHQTQLKLIFLLFRPKSRPILKKWLFLNYRPQPINGYTW